MVATPEALQLLWAATLAVGVTVLVLLILPRLLRRHFGAGVAYAAWWLVPAVFIASLLPGRTVQTVAVTQTLRIIAEPVAMAPVAVIEDRSLVWWLAVWLIGVVVMTLRLWRQQRRFERSLGLLQPLPQRLWRSQSSHGLPAVVGVVRAKIVLPADFAQRYDDEQRRLMLAHERRHLQCGDPLANLAVAIVRCLFWFNPLVHLAAARFRHDQELACDQAVVAAHPQSRRAYGEAMLKTLMTGQQAPLGCHWGLSHPMKERVMQLKSPIPHRWMRRVGIAAVAMLMCGAGFAVWSAQPARAVSSINADFSADILMRIDGGDTETFAIANDFGKPFSFSHQGERGGRIDVDATVREAGASRYDIAMVLKQGGRELARPRLIVARGESAVVKVGDDMRSGFKGVEVAVTIGVEASSAGHPWSFPPVPPVPPVPPAPPAPPEAPDLLVQADGEQAGASIDQARAAKEEAEASIDQARAAREQAEASIDQARAAKEQAEAAREQAEAAAQEAEANARVHAQEDSTRQ